MAHRWSRWRSCVSGFSQPPPRDLAICLLGCYLMPGGGREEREEREEERQWRERVEEAQRRQVDAAICLRACYAMSGTGIAYADVSTCACAMRCPVLTSRNEG
eukprot:2622994-Rhodomonas_salina.1